MTADIEGHYETVRKFIDPFTKGNGGDHKGKGGDPQVIAAREAYGSLQILKSEASREKTFDKHSKQKIQDLAQQVVDLSNRLKETHR